MMTRTCWINAVQHECIEKDRNTEFNYLISNSAFLSLSSMQSVAQGGGH